MMKFNFLFFLILIINLVSCDLPQDQKLSIDNLIQIYNLGSLPNGNYCELPQYFKCDTTNNYIEIINLIGDINNKPNLQEDTFIAFVNLTTLSITNSKVPNLQYIYTKLLNKISFDNCEFESFPKNLPILNELKMNDVLFNGNINLTTIDAISTFTLTYSSSDLISNYQFILDGDLSFKALRDYKITVNNIFPVFPFANPSSKITFILGKYFDSSSLIYLENLSITTFNMIDIGHFNREITKPILSKAQNLKLNNLQFNIQENFNFKSPLQSLTIDNCTGLEDLNGDGNIRINSYQFGTFSIFNSGLKKVPYFYDILTILFLDNNTISGELPYLSEPESISGWKTFSFNNNNFSGTIPKNYCYHSISLKNNQLSGELPMCFVCSLGDISIKNQIDGNNFSNYISGSTTGLPVCSGIIIRDSKIVIHNGQTVSIYGENLGFTSVDYQGFQIVSTPSANYNFEVPNKILKFSASENFINLLKFSNYKSNLLFKIPNINVTLQFELSAPIINNVTVSPDSNNGYIFNIYGLSFASNQYNMTVFIDDYPCLLSSQANNLLVCTVYQTQMPEKVYTIKVYSSQTGLTGTFQYKFERIYPYISAITSPTTNGGTITLYGSYGTNRTTVSVLIGNENCLIQQTGVLEIICTIGPGSGVKDVYLNVDGVDWHGVGIFTYLNNSISTQCLGSPPCNGHGNCINYSICYCFKGYGGVTCNERVLDDVAVKKNETLTEILNNGYSFGFSITDIREVDFSNKVVRQHNFTSWELTDDSTTIKWTYMHVYGNAQISYTIERILNEPKNFTFAGEFMTLQPGSLKLTASINNWEYLGSLNTLQLQIKSSVNIQEGMENDECKNQQESNIKTNSGDGISINYITIEKDNNVFSGRFIDKVESDGRPTYSKVTLSEQTKDSITVTLALPYCKVCKIDPDFSVMISPSFSSKCNANSSSKLKWVIPVSVILGLLGLFGVFALFFFLLRSKIYISRKAGIIVLKKSKKSKSIDETVQQQ